MLGFFGVSDGAKKIRVAFGQKIGVLLVDVGDEKRREKQPFRLGPLAEGPQKRLLLLAELGERDFLDLGNAEAQAFFVVFLAIGFF